LAEAKRGFEQWRRQEKRRGRIPEDLWEMAVGAARIHGVRATARQLRLNATKLKKRIQPLKQGPVSEDRPGFVELPWLGTAPVSECVMEAEDRAGKKLRIHLKGAAVAQAASLGHLLWRGRG
jgi:hypothetical protein